MSKITPRTLIYDAYRSLAVLRPGQSPSDDACDDALRSLNDMLDAWQLERLMVYGIRGTAYALTGAPPWTLGPAGTLGETRPLRVESAGLIHSGSPETDLPVLTLDGYRAQRCGVYIDGGYPLSNVYVNPSPSGGESLVLYSWAPISQFAHLDERVDFAPGYAKALRWCLAAELIPGALIQAKIPAVLHAKIEQQAADSKGWVKSFHSTPPPVMTTDLGCGCGSYNIQTDSWY